MGMGGVSKQAKDIEKSVGGCLMGLLLLPFKIIWDILTLPFKGRKH